MNPAATAQTPALATVLGDHIRQIGRALRIEAFALLGIMTLVTITGLYVVAMEGDTLDFPWDASLLMAFAGLLLPFSIWKGDQLFGDSPLWTLPVERQTHALIKTAAGGLWLIAAMTAVIGWFVILEFVSSGGGETRFLLTSASVGAQPATVRAFQWTPEAWQYAVPMGAAVIAYLFASAVKLGARYPLRWGAGLVFGVMLMAAGPDPVFESVMEWFFMGPLGLDYALTGGFEHVERQVSLADGRTVVAWTETPTAGAWVTAVLMWIMAGAAAVVLATFRHREF